MRLVGVAGRGRGRAAAAVLLAALVAACGASGGEPSGTIEVDGSVALFPLTDAIGEAFVEQSGGAVWVSVGLSTTGAGLLRFCGGETDLSNASRAMTAWEYEECVLNGVRPLDLTVAQDAVIMVVNQDNDFARCLKEEELRSIWRAGSRVRRWADVRPEWPAEPMPLYGPPTESGTFEFLAEQLTDDPAGGRLNYTALHEPNDVANNVAARPNALGTMSFAHYQANRDRVRALQVNGGGGCITPTEQAIQTGRYMPLSRPLLLYVSQEALRRPAVQAYLDFYWDTAPELAAALGFLPLNHASYAANRSRLQRALSR